MLRESARTLLAVLALRSGAAASPLILSGSQGNLAASVVFEVADFSNLRIALSNTSSADVGVPAEVLTALFFDLPGNPLLTPASAVLAPTSTVLFGSAGPGGVVGGEWAYAAGLSGAPGGAQQGVSSVGLGLFGPHDLFPGVNLAGPVSPDGLQYGITSAGDDPALGSQAVTGKQALIRNAVIFTLSGLPEGFALSGISHVSFQYGTDLAEPSFSTHTPEPASAEPSFSTHSPEPASLVLALIGFTLLFGGTLRRKLGKHMR